jgi:lipoprotein-anchoring transpeptidase ErfK/SrfK
MKAAVSIAALRAPARRAAFVLAAASLLPAVAAADLYRLASPNDSVIGVPFYVKTHADHTLLDIGRHHGLGFDEMEQANPNVDMWVPGEGTDVLVPNQHVLPSAPREGIVVNLAEKRLYFYRSPTEVESFSIGVGREGWETPVGSYSIIEKTENPTWTPPASIRARYAEEGRAGQPARRLSAAAEQPQLSDPRHQQALGRGHAGELRLHPHVSGGYRIHVRKGVGRNAGEGGPAAVQGGLAGRRPVPGGQRQ